MLEEPPGSATGLSDTELRFDFVAILLDDDVVFRMQGFNAILPLLLLPPLLLLLVLIVFMWGVL